MLGELRRHIPRLAEAVAQARAGGKPELRLGRPPAPPRPSSARAKTAPPPARQEDRSRRPSDYDKLTASDVVGKLTDFTQAQLRTSSPTSAPTASAPR